MAWRGACEALRGMVRRCEALRGMVRHYALILRIGAKEKLRGVMVEALRGVMVEALREALRGMA